MVDGRIKSDVVVREADLIVEFIQKVAPFHSLTLNTLAKIADKMWAEQVLEGETVIRQGDPGENFYLVRQGELEIVKGEDGHERSVATITEGDCFGEEALLTGNPRNATVRAKKDSLLYVLGEEDFKSAVAASDSLRDELRKVLFDRQ
jgi:putative ABC transport system ATP-binding protein